MKKLFFTLLFAAVLSSISASAQTIDLGKFTIDKNTCTITRKSDGKKFPLYGRVEIVDHNPDLRVEIVDHNPDIYVMAHYPCDCGEYELVDHNPDLRIELVDHNPDLTVEVRDHHPHINR
ncbi:MAG: hypothetical protein IKP73_01315 [Bacteroidales bacterium]|nr:hypothetical protein [Bacteroidales bacterium]